MSPELATVSLLPESIPIPRKRGIFALFRGIGTLGSALLGLATTVLVLAVVSSLPVINLLSLGFLLESSGRIARSGRLRDGFVGLSRFASAGRILLASWLWILPIRLIHSYWRDAELIQPGSDTAARLRVLLVIMILAIGAHLVWACLRGGKWHHFLWPAPLRFWRGLGENLEAGNHRRKLISFLKELHLFHFFRLGALGFAGAAIWLAIPVLVLMLASTPANPAPAALGSLLGSVLLAGVSLYLPFLQTRFAMTGRFGEFFSIRAARDLFSRAPFAFWLALFVTLLFALPLYLLKIELTPNEIAWLPNLVFVLFIFPARLLLGWAVSRAERHENRRFWLSRWTARLAAIPVVATYAFVVWLTQYLSWHGSLSLLEQHAFLVPAPLLGL